MKMFRAVALSCAALAATTAANAQDAPKRPAITGVSHIAVYSADLAKTEAFYVHDLGGDKQSDPENTKGVRYYFGPVQFVEVLPLPEGTSVNRLDHVAYITADVEGLRLYLSAKGVTVPAKASKGRDGSRWIDVKDPEDNIVEFVQPPANPPSVSANPLSGHIIHVGYIVHDRAREDTFYRDVLGFRPYWYGGMKDDAPPEWVSQQVPDGTDWLEYMVKGTPDTKGIPEGWSRDTAGIFNHFSLGVDNIERTVTLLTAGGRITGKNDGPKIGRDGKWQFNMYDPDGTRAELMEFHAVGQPCCSAFTAIDPVQ